MVQAGRSAIARSVVVSEVEVGRTDETMDQTLVGVSATELGGTAGTWIVSEEEVGGTDRTDF